MGTPALLETLATCAETFKAWQDEYLELKKIIDDGDNAKRRQGNGRILETEGAESERESRIRKQTQKATDATHHSVIIEGKRNRKPHILDNQSQQLSRAPTLVFAAAATRLRRNCRTAATMELTNREATTEHAAQPAPKKRGWGKGNANGAQDISAVATPEALMAIQVEDQIDVGKSNATRKRDSATKNTELSTTTNVGGPIQTEEPEAQDAKIQRTTKSPSGLALATDISPSSILSSITVDIAGAIELSSALGKNRKRNYAADKEPDFGPWPICTSGNPSRHQEGPTTQEVTRRRFGGSGGPSFPASKAGQHSTRTYNVHI